jgi:hypothetical protein
VIEWLSLSKLIPAGSPAVKSLYDRVIGKSPRLNFDADSGGIKLQIVNTRRNRHRGAHRSLAAEAPIYAVKMERKVCSAPMSGHR